MIDITYPDCKANHAEWSLLAKSTKNRDVWIYCMTTDGKDYPFKRFWCQTCALLLPMFGVKNVYMWDSEWAHHNSNTLIKEVNYQINK